MIWKCSPYANLRYSAQSICRSHLIIGLRHRESRAPSLPRSLSSDISLGRCGKCAVNAARQLYGNPSDGTNPTEEVRAKTCVLVRRIIKYVFTMKKWFDVWLYVLQGSMMKVPFRQTSKSFPWMGTGFRAGIILSAPLSCFLCSAPPNKILRLLCANTLHNVIRKLQKTNTPHLTLP